MPLANRLNRLHHDLWKLPKWFMILCGIVCHAANKKLSLLSLNGHKSHSIFEVIEFLHAHWTPFWRYAGIFSIELSCFILQNILNDEFCFLVDPNIIFLLFNYWTIKRKELSGRSERSCIWFNCWFTMEMPTLRYQQINN